MFTIVTPRSPEEQNEVLPGRYSKRARLDPDTMMEDDDDASSSSLVALPGEVIAHSRELMRGHGTYVSEEEVLAAVAGNVERVNKLVSVKPLRGRYRPEVGDLIVGRITEVQPRRWKVDANSPQDAILMLSSINLPGGVQRRKLESDELQMRNFFQEGDLLVAEVQAFFADGAMSLHTRSLRYGKLRNGILVRVPSALIVRMKTHFHTLPCGVDLILGLNGYVWICMHKADQDGTKKDGGEGFDNEVDAEGVYSDRNDDIPADVSIAITRVSLVIQALARHEVPIDDSVIAEAYEYSLDLTGEDAIGGLRLLADESVQGQIVDQVLAR